MVSSQKNHFRGCRSSLVSSQKSHFGGCRSSLVSSQKNHFGGCFGLYELFFPRSTSSEFFIFCEAHPKTKMCAHSWGGGIIVCYNVHYNKNYEFFGGGFGGGGGSILCRFLLIFGG